MAYPDGSKPKTKRRHGPLPTENSDVLRVRVSPEMKAVLNKAVAESDGSVTRSDVVRTIIRDWMERNQMLPDKTPKTVERPR